MRIISHRYRCDICNGVGVNSGIGGGAGISGMGGGAGISGMGGGAGISGMGGGALASLAWVEALHLWHGWGRYLRHGRGVHLRHGWRGWHLWHGWRGWNLGMGGGVAQTVQGAEAYLLNRALEVELGGRQSMAWRWRSKW